MTKEKTSANLASRDKIFMVSNMAAVRKLVLALAIISVSLGGNWVGAQIHHVVGGDRGWDPSSGVGSWSDGRIFSVGDKLWFTYSAAQESIAELKSKEEFESCDMSNPIKMYTDGIDSISLDGEGIRYFVSSKPENCKEGLKLHVDVHPPQSKPEIQTVATSEGAAMAVADGPTTPSGSTHLVAVTSTPLLVVSLIYFLMG